MEAILVDYLQTVGQLARRCIKSFGGQKGGFERTPQTPPAYGPGCHAVEKKAERCLCVEQSRELFSKIRGRGGASNACFHS